MENAPRELLYYDTGLAARTLTAGTVTGVPGRQEDCHGCCT